MLHPTEAGVPQGGVISPLLLNVALHGMEQALGISYTPKGVRRGIYALVRYADDLVVFSPTYEQAVEAQALLRGVIAPHPSPQAMQLLAHAECSAPYPSRSSA